MENDFSDRQLSIVHFQFILCVPADAEVNRQAGDDEASETDGERPGVGAGGVEEIPADPGPEGAAEAEADFQKSFSLRRTQRGEAATETRNISRKNAKAQRSEKNG